MSGGVRECACGHGLQWHHETRGCGYHGFSERDRCECRLTFDEALERVVAEARAEERASMQVAGYAAGTMRVVEVGQAQRALDAAREAGRAEVVAKVEEVAARMRDLRESIPPQETTQARAALDVAEMWLRAALGRQAGGGE